MTKEVARHRGVQGIESAFCDLLESEMRQDGWQVQREVPVPGGFIDLVATKDLRRMVIEVKASAGRQDVRHALGQLVFYAYYEREAQLFFASPERPSPEMIALLEFYQVGVYPTWQQQRGADEAIEPDPWAIPTVMRDGQRWTTAKAEKSYYCPVCGEGFPVRPVVCAAGDAVEDHDRVLSRVWDVDFSCPKCGHDPYLLPFKGERVRADDSQIQAWTYLLGPWRRAR